MAVKVETGVCVGRGFADTDVNGFCAKFKEWVVKAEGAGGPGWFIIRDRSTIPVAVSISARPTTTTLTVVAHGFINGEPVRVTASTMSLTAGTKYYVRVVDVDTISLSTSWYNWLISSYVTIGTYAAGNTILAFGPYIIVSDVAAPVTQDSAKIVKFGYDPTVSTYAYMQFFLSKGDTNSHPIAEWAGYRVSTLDGASDNFTYNFRGESGFLLIQSFISSWTRIGIDTWTRLPIFLEDPSTVGGVVSGDVVYSPGINNTVVTLASSGQVDTLTVGQGYYLWFAGVVSGQDNFHLIYGIINKKGLAGGLGANQVEFSFLSAGTLNNTIRSGAVVTPYYHRFFAYSGVAPNSADLSNQKMCIPYVSYNADSTTYRNFHSQSNSTIYSAITESVENTALNKGAQDNGDYYGQALLITEYYTHGASATQTSMNRMYGESVHMVLTNSTGLSDMSTGRTIDGTLWVSIGVSNTIIPNGSSSLHMLVPSPT